jgi:hypothetical protein
VTEDKKMTEIDWILSDDTGCSSKTIWAVMMGSDYPKNDIPCGPSDFGRCYKLLLAFPEWNDRLHEVAEKHPKWRPLIDKWNELSRLYEEELSREDGRAPNLFQMLKSLYDDCMRADGWEKTGAHSWERGRQFCGSIDS